MFNIFRQIPLRIDPFFWIVIIFIGYLNSSMDFDTTDGKITGTILWVGIILFSVIVHEYGHALTAIAFGQSAKIELIGIGGVTQRSGKKPKLWQDFIIVLNGPLFSLLLAFLVYIILKKIVHLPKQNLIAYGMQVTVDVNIFWTFVNLLPVQPLDGGRLLSIILEAIFGVKGVKIALFLSILLAGLFGLAFFLAQFMIGGALFFLLAFESYRTWKASLPLTEKDQDTPLQEKLREAEVNMQQGKKDQAIDSLKEIRNSTQEGIIHLTATQHLAHLLYEKGEFKEAYQHLYPLKNKVDYNSLRLLQQLAYYSGEWNAAVELGTRSYQIVPSYDTALLNALSFALLGNAQPAVGWIECAIRDGMPNVRAILNKTEFDPIRHTSEFQELLKNQLS